MAIPSTLGGLFVAFLGIISANESRLGGQRRTWGSGSPGSTARTPNRYSASPSKNWARRGLPDEARALAGPRFGHRGRTAFTASPYSAPTDALRHPLKNGMEAGGIELTLDHRKPFAGCAV